MNFRMVLFSIVALSLAGSAQAATKAYDSSRENGTPSDFVNTATNLCPPVQTSPGIFQGFVILTDDSAGTVTLTTYEGHTETLIDLGPDQLTLTFGPGAFIFIDALSTTTTDSPHVSNTSGVGAHGPSGTNPGETAEWGIVSGWSATGRNFCVSSPVAICNNSNFAHGATIDAADPSSDTFDLGTWNFDSVGNYSTGAPYISATANGGLQNNRSDLRGAFVGASLPALPLVGFGALALGLAVIGGRALAGRK